MNKINPALDPATFVGLAAKIQSGGDLRELVDHADQLLAAIAGDNFTILERQEASAQLICNDLARNCLLKAMQCTDPKDAAAWQANAKRAFDMVNDSIKRMSSLNILTRVRLPATQPKQIPTTPPAPTVSYAPTVTISGLIDEEIIDDEALTVDSFSS